MFVKPRAIWHIIRSMGSGRQVMEQVNGYTRFCVLDTLREVGLFEFLKQPRSFREIRDEFGFIDSDYLTDVLVVLVNDKDELLTLDGERYVMAADKHIPTFDEFKTTVPERVTAFYMIRDLAREIINRLRRESSELARRLEAERDQMTNFDAALSNRLYDASRQATHIWARPLMGDLSGKTMLEVGCGSGRETAQLWNLTEGKVKITAIDPVSAFIDLAKERLSKLVSEMADGKTPPALTSEMSPVFRVMTATQLEFPDAHFDYVFHSAMLHWTPDPKKAIGEMIRVLKPGGVIYGVAAVRPWTNDYLHLILRINENVHGFFWLDDMIKWHQEHGAEVQTLMAGMYRAKKAG